MVDQSGSPQTAVLAQLALVRLHGLLVRPSLVLDVRRLVGQDGGAGVAGVVLHVGQLVGEVLPGRTVGLLTVLQHDRLLIVRKQTGPALVTDLLEVQRVSYNAPTAGDIWSSFQD